MSTIFVQIASYRDPQLIPTLQDMVKNADNPEGLHITICWQHADDETIEMFLDTGFDIGSSVEDKPDGFKRIDLTYEKAKIKLIQVHYLQTQGACWARNLIQQEYDGETYTMQLDSHHRFIEHWDTEVIDQLESVREESVFKKPLLTGYISSFDPEHDPQARVLEPWKMDFDRFIPEGAVFFIPSTIDDWKKRKNIPMRSRYFSAHFVFADGTFAVEVQHDPEYFFHGEEISLAARAFTHGYDLYHPMKVIAWHEYTRKGRIKVWDDHTTPQKKRGKIGLDWVERNDICHRRNRILFGMDGEDPNQIDFGKYGFGDKRTLKQYEEYAGMSFKNRAVQQITLDRVEPPMPKDAKSYDSVEEWEKTLTRSNDVRVLFPKADLIYRAPETDEIETNVNDYDFWYVGTHDENGDEVHRKDATQPDISNYLRGEWVDFRFIYLSNKIAKTFTVWPHSTSKGWGDKIVRDIN